MKFPTCLICQDKIGTDKSICRYCVRYIRNIENGELHAQNIDVQLIKEMQSYSNIILHKKSLEFYYFDEEVIKEIKRCSFKLDCVKNKAQKERGYKKKVYYFLYTMFEKRVIYNLLETSCDRHYLCHEIRKDYERNSCSHCMEPCAHTLNCGIRIPLYFAIRKKRIQQIFKNSVLLSKFRIVLSVYLVDKCGITRKRYAEFKKSETYNCIVNKYFKDFTLVEDLIRCNVIREIETMYFRIG